MKVRDLVNKDFENVNLKKVELPRRFKIFKTKQRSLKHQIAIIDLRLQKEFVRLKELGKAFRIYDPQFKEDGKNIKIGILDYTVYYTKDFPGSESLTRFLDSQNNRKAYLETLVKGIRRQLIGMKSAMTRKGI